MPEQLAAAVSGLVNAIREVSPLASRTPPEHHSWRWWGWFSRPVRNCPEGFRAKYGAEVFARLLVDTDAADQVVLARNFATVTTRLRDVSSCIKKGGGVLLNQVFEELLAARCYVWRMMAGSPPYLLQDPVPVEDALLQNLRDAAMRQVEQPKKGADRDGDGFVAKGVAMTALGLTRAKMDTYQSRHPDLFRSTSPNRCKVDVANLAVIVAEEKRLAEANAIIKSEDPQEQKQIEKRIAAERANKEASRKTKEEPRPPGRRSIMEF